MRSSTCRAWVAHVDVIDHAGDLALRVDDERTRCAMPDAARTPYAEAVLPPTSASRACFSPSASQNLRFEATSCTLTPKTMIVALVEVGLGGGQ